MDPRRARDPRLARADPRLHSNSPAPTSAPVAAQAPAFNNVQQQQHQAQGGYPPSEFANGQPPSGPSSAELYSSQPSASNIVPAQHVPAPVRPAYKAKPLFCVVCASNQVSSVHQCEVQTLHMDQNRSMEAHSVLAYVASNPCLFWN